MRPVFRSHSSNMAPQDSTAPFLAIPWTASLLSRPDTIVRVPGSRERKPTEEDSLFAETLKGSRTIRHCISYYTRPGEDARQVDEVSTLVVTGSGMDGHPRVLHGGIVATLLDEAIGILQTVNHEHEHRRRVREGSARGGAPERGLGSFTAELVVRYKRPVLTPGPLVVAARYTKREGRKDWIYAEVRQQGDGQGSGNGEEVVCATGEALFVVPKASRM